MKQLCDELSQFAIQVRQLGYSHGGVGERECLDLSERMLAAVKQAEARMASKLHERPAGTPLSRWIARYERRKTTPFPDFDDPGETIIAEWPNDRAAAMLEAWRTECAGPDLHTMRQAVDVDSRRAAQAATEPIDVYRTAAT